jgi:CheY-like chemotaxis protein
MMNVVIVSELTSFYIKVIKEKLEEAGYGVTTVSADLDEINNIETSVSGVLIYIDEKLLTQHKALIFLKDRAVEEDFPVFVIGGTGEIDRISSMIPKELIRGAFTRPIDMPAVVAAIEKQLNEYAVMKKVLVVDDNSTTLRSVKAWLQGKYNVYIANSGTMAIKYLTLVKPDLVLLDYEMPICDGRQVLEMIRSETEFEKVPVIFLTGKNTKERFLSVQSLKPEGYLLKSMEPGQIVKAIDDFFMKKRLAGY